MSYEGGDHLWRTHTFNFTLHILWNPQQREPPVLGPRLWINYPWLHDIRQLASPLLPLINYSQWKSNHVCYYCWSSVTYLFPSSFPPSFLLIAMNHFGVTFASLVEIYKDNVSLIQCQTAGPVPHMIPRGCTLPTLVSPDFATRRLILVPWNLMYTFKLTSGWIVTTLVKPCFFIWCRWSVFVRFQKMCKSTDGGNPE